MLCEECLHNKYTGYCSTKPRLSIISLLSVIAKAVSTCSTPLRLQVALIEAVNRIFVTYLELEAFFACAVVPVLVAYSMKHGESYLDK